MRRPFRAIEVPFGFPFWLPMERERETLLVSGWWIPTQEVAELIGKRV